MSYYYIKKNVSKKEYLFQKYALQLEFPFVPKIYSYNEKKKELKMQRIPNMSIADYYGDNFENIPEHIIVKIREIIGKLYQRNIVFPDITAYNFIEYKNKIWIIDFEHCYYVNQTSSVPFIEHENMGLEDKEINHTFVVDFIEGKKSWNPYFA